MARQSINIGAAANDGTGDTIRNSYDKCNDNFEELYSVLGWANYSDAESSPATQTITSTPSKLQIDGAGTLSNSSYLPREIRGSAELWDTTNDLITPIKTGDTYDVRITLEVTAESGSPAELKCEIDIGGGGSPTNVIATDYAITGKSTPYIKTFNFPIFSLATFLANGGAIFLSTNTGTLTIASRAIFIKRTFKGDM